MVNEKEAAFCREALEALGFTWYGSGGDHFHHMKDFGEFQVLLNGLNHIDDVGELVTNRRSAVFASFESEQGCHSMTFYNLADVVGFFSNYEVSKKGE